MGVDAYLNKPWTEEDLMRLVQRAIAGDGLKRSKLNGAGAVLQKGAARRAARVNLVF